MNLGVIVLLLFCLLPFIIAYKNGGALDGVKKVRLAMILSLTFLISYHIIPAYYSSKNKVSKPRPTGFISASETICEYLETDGKISGLRCEWGLRRDDD